MPVRSWQETGGQVTAIRGPTFGIGIRRHPHDIHDHTTSVVTGWKRHDLQEVRDTREVQSFIAAQQAHKTSVRSENVQAMHASNAEVTHATAEKEWGGAVGPIHESASRLAKEIAAATGCNTTQSLTLLQRHGWSIEAAVRAFTVSGNPGLQNPLRDVPDAGTQLASTANIERWHPHMVQHAPTAGDGKTKCQFTGQAMPQYRVSSELDPMRRPDPAYKRFVTSAFDGVAANAGAAGGGQKEGGGTGAGAD